MLHLLLCQKTQNVIMSHMIQPPINKQKKKVSHNTMNVTQVKTTFRQSKISHTKKSNFTKSNSNKRERRSNRLIPHVHNEDIDRRRDNDGGSKLRLIRCCDGGGDGSPLKLLCSGLRRRRRDHWSEFHLHGCNGGVSPTFLLKYIYIYIYIQISVFCFYMDFGGFN